MKTKMATLVKHAKLFCRLNTQIYPPTSILDSFKSQIKICKRCHLSSQPTMYRKYSQHVNADHGEETIPRLTWKLMGAVCLERPPIITTDMSKIEQDYMKMVDELEYEASVLSDHEIQLNKDREQMKQKQQGELDDEDSSNLLTAQDIEDLATEEYNRFKTANKHTEADKTGGMTTSHRKLDENLILFVKNEIGNQSVWMLPQTEHLPGESLCQTAERAAMQVGSGANVTFFGNAPIGFYKYKFPNKVKSETGAIGAKVFIFRAKVLKGQFSVLEGAVGQHAWVNKDEMKEYLVPAYLESILRFIR
ncbi:large ribosomal subunit protein mL46-like [Antedon mediterranea]|uniref:large ribosomal subunit protein mL46-like n=1 Tax=Antedon mediterranea TaxID=105859 RepID=UPI003AF61E3D